MGYFSRRICANDRAYAAHTAFAVRFSSRIKKRFFLLRFGRDRPKSLKRGPTIERHSPLTLEYEVAWPPNSSEASVKLDGRNFRPDCLMRAVTMRNKIIVSCFILNDARLVPAVLAEKGGLHGWNESRDAKDRGLSRAIFAHNGHQRKRTLLANPGGRPMIQKEEVVWDGHEIVITPAGDREVRSQGLTA